MRKEHSFAIISILLGIGLSLVIAEGAMRLLAPPWLETRMNFLNPASSNRGFGNDGEWKVEKRDGSFLQFQRNTQFDISHTEYNTVAHIDDLGTRRIYPIGAVKGGPVVPLLGDSFTFGIGVEDQETFSSLLAKEFSRVNFINVGVPGTALDVHLHLVRQRHDEFGKPIKVVFFFFLGNDFADILNSAEKKVPAAPAPMSNSADNANTLPIGWLQKFWMFVNYKISHNPILRHSYLIQLARSFVLQMNNTLKRKSGDQPDAYPLFLIMDRTDDRYYARAQHALEEQIESLVALQKKLDFTSLVIVIPDSHQINNDARAALANMYGYDQANLDPSRPNQQVERTLRKVGIRFYDATSCLKSSPASADLYYKTDNHFTKVGHSKFAECIKPELESFLQ